MAQKRSINLPLWIIIFTLLMWASSWIPPLFIRALSAGVCALAVLGLALYQLRRPSSIPQSESPDSEPLRGAVTEATVGEVPPTTPPSPDSEETVKTEKLQEEAHTHISEALAGMAKVIPILNEQLKAVIDYTEDSAMKLSQSFISINRKAKDQVENVRSIFGSLSDEKNSTETEGVLVNIRANLNSLTEGLDALLAQINKNSEAIHNIVRQTKSIEEIVATTNEITENSRVLSINATIEAARAGEHGRGFAVVAGEFKQMTERSEEATREIENTVQMISKLITSVQQELEESKEISRRLGDQTKTQGRESVDKIDTVIVQAREDLDKLSRQAQDFAKDINSIIVSIQFQDITRQRIEHVIEPLQEFSMDLEKIAGYIEHIEQAETLQQLNSFDSAVDRLKHKYTMEAEKELMEKSLINKEEA